MWKFIDRIPTWLIFWIFIIGILLVLVIGSSQKSEFYYEQPQQIEQRT